MSNTTSVAELRKPTQLAQQSDTRVDMFSMQGFALANRIAMAYSSSDAVPAAFRSHNLKKTGQGEEWVENQSAVGNCIVAIEVAQAVGMSIAAVMQNADVIEGKLRWSDKFVVGAVNASGRFTPLRYDIRNMGTIKAKYREKLGWNREKKGFDFADREVEIENLVCVAWALPAGFQIPAGVATLEQARKAGLPVIEGAPVSIKLAVEEGWYSKPGSKWQTELKHKMLTMRAGRYFGDMHASDVVMGIGRTTEEVIDMGALEAQPDGSYAPVAAPEQKAAPVTVESLRRSPAEAPNIAPAEAPNVSEAAPNIEPAADQAEPKKWEPTPEEAEAIRERELAEAKPARRRGADIE